MRRHLRTRLPQKGNQAPSTHALNCNTNKNALIRHKWEKRSCPSKMEGPAGRAQPLRLGLAAAAPAQRAGGPRQGGGVAGGRQDAAGRAGDPLTFSQPVLEVGVAPSLAVEVNAVPDEEGPAHAGGDGAIPAHHL